MLHFISINVHYPAFISRLFRILCLHMMLCFTSCNSKCLGCVLVQRESKSSDFKGVSGVYVLCNNYECLCNFNKVNPIFVPLSLLCDSSLHTRVAWKFRRIIWFWIFKFLKKKISYFLRHLILNFVILSLYLASGWWILIQ